MPREYLTLQLDQHIEIFLYAIIDQCCADTCATPTATNPGHPQPQKQALSCVEVAT